MVWIERDLIDHLVPTTLPWAGTPSTRPGCSEPRVGGRSRYLKIQDTKTAKYARETLKSVAYL